MEGGSLGLLRLVDVLGRLLDELCLSQVLARQGCATRIIMIIMIIMIIITIVMIIVIMVIIVVIITTTIIICIVINMYMSA